MSNLNIDNWNPKVITITLTKTEKTELQEVLIIAKHHAPGRTDSINRLMNKLKDI